MSEENKGKAQEDVEALKAKITELHAENEKLKKAVAEATQTLTAYVEREKEAVIKQILEKANLSEDELKKLDLPQIKLMQKTVDSVKGTVKNIRSAGEGNSEESGLTVGCLYHKE
jgi:prefoldin subunit 5